LGFGDELMMAGEFRALPDPRPVLVYRRGKPFWHEAWNGNPRFVRPADAATTPHQVYHTPEGRVRRPYQDNERTTADRWAWRPYRPKPGELYFSADEIDFAKPFDGRRFVLIEPHIKAGAPVNKDYGFARWQEVVKLRPDIAWIQTGPAGARPLSGVQFLSCPSVRHACAVMAHAAAYVGPEGGMHHAAAALAKPAVVVFGGYVSPEITGYDTHKNIFTGGTACGWRKPCQHCAEAMAKITPAQVIQALEEILEQIPATSAPDHAA
jgi:hypothetical protein